MNVNDVRERLREAGTLLQSEAHYEAALKAHYEQRPKKPEVFHDEETLTSYMNLTAVWENKRESLQAMRDSASDAVEDFAKHHLSRFPRGVPLSVPNTDYWLQINTDKTPVGKYHVTLITHVEDPDFEDESDDRGY